MTTPAQKPRPRANQGAWANILKSVSTPLGFYALILLIIDGPLAIVLTFSKLSEEHTWWGTLLMMSFFIVVLIIVTLLTIFKPKNLVYGKEEHSNPQLAPSALKDDIEKLIHQNVKTECLKNPR